MGSAATDDTGWASPAARALGCVCGHTTGTPRAFSWHASGSEVPSVFVQPFGATRNANLIGTMLKYIYMHIHIYIIYIYIIHIYIYIIDTFTNNDSESRREV